MKKLLALSALLLLSLSRLPAQAVDPLPLLLAAQKKLVNSELLIESLKSGIAASQTIITNLLSEKDGLQQIINRQQTELDLASMSYQKQQAQYQSQQESWNETMEKLSISYNNLSSYSKEQDITIAVWKSRFKFAIGAAAALAALLAIAFYVGRKK